MTEQEKHDASLGRMMRHFARFHGAALLTMLVLICIFGEEFQAQPGWKFYTALASGLLVTFLLWRNDKKREKEQDMSGGCDGSTRVYEALRTGSTPVPDTVTKCQKGLHSLDK